MEFNLAEGRLILERTPRTLQALLRGLPDGWTRANEGPKTWSPLEVVAHLINGERTDWIPRARLILAGDATATFVPFEREGFFVEARTVPLPELLDLFERLREENLQVLDGMKIGERELALVAQHPGLGPVTMRELLASWVVHDLGHLVQISRTIARQYGGAVGPWTEYMGVLTR
ncbi:MAG TPA: DinB family protein [Gemmatimonadaceae bacterium]